MGFFGKIRERIAKAFNQPTAPAPEHKGFFERRREAREEKRIRKEWERSQRRQEKMEREAEKQKQKRRSEERQQKREAEQRAREAHEKARDTFLNNWGFTPSEYEGFIQFVDGLGSDLKEAFGSENLVEAFRTGRSLGLNPSDMKAVLEQTYNMGNGGTQEDFVNDLYANMNTYAISVSEGAFV